MKEAQGRFRKASDDLDSALNKHVGAPKTKPIECDEAANQLLVSRSKFTAASLEYTDKVCLQIKLSELVQLINKFISSYVHLSSGGIWNTVRFS